MFNIHRCQFCLFHKHSLHINARFNFFFKSGFGDCARVQIFLQSLEDFISKSIFSWKYIGNARKSVCSQISTPTGLTSGSIYQLAHCFFSWVCSSAKDNRGKWWVDDILRSLLASSITWFCENYLKFTYLCLQTYELFKLWTDKIFYLNILFASIY